MPGGGNKYDTMTLRFLDPVKGSDVEVHKSQPSGSDNFTTMVLRNLPRMSCDGSMFGADSVEIIDHDEFGRMPVVALPPGKYTFKAMDLTTIPPNDWFLYRSGVKQDKIYATTTDSISLLAVVIDGSDYELMWNTPEDKIYENPVKMGFILGINSDKTYIYVRSDDYDAPPSDPSRPQPGDTLSPSRTGLRAETAILTATRLDIIEGADAR